MVLDEFDNFVRRSLNYLMNNMVLDVSRRPPPPRTRPHVTDRTAPVRAPRATVSDESTGSRGTNEQDD